MDDNSSSWVSKFCSSAGRAKTLSHETSHASLSTEHTLCRGLSLLDLLVIGVGATIGAGIFVITGTVAHDIGPGVTLSFLLAGASSALNALCFAELASRFPAVVGGAYLYTYTAFNELTAFLVFTQLILDYHVTGASITRSLAGYIIEALELFPFFKDNVPSWIGHGSEKFLGAFSINLLAPIILLLVTAVLCWGVKESSKANLVMTTTKVIIVLFIIIVGAFEVDVSNWSPFTPNGFKPVLTGATIVSFAYVGFDSVANSAEESKRPQRDLPLAIMGSVLICSILYIGVCLVITGMVPYLLLGGDAPLVEAFKYRGLKYFSLVISIAADIGLMSGLLVGLYVKARLYLGLARDGLFPSIFAKVHPKTQTPIHSQVWVGFVAAVLAGLFNVEELSHFLSVGCLTAYTAVSASVIILRWKDNKVGQDSMVNTKCHMGVVCLILICCCGFGAGVFYRFDAPSIFSILAVIIAGLASIVLACQQVYVDLPGFSCPGVPIVPAISIFSNLFLFAQLHYLGWLRFIVINIISVAIYAFYGQFHSSPNSSLETLAYQRFPESQQEQ